MSYKNYNIDTIESHWFQWLFVFLGENKVLEKQALKIKFEK